MMKKTIFAIGGLAVLILLTVVISIVLDKSVFLTIDGSNSGATIRNVIALMAAMQIKDTVIELYKAVAKKDQKTETT